MTKMEKETEKLIVASARRLFIEKGFKGATMRDIAVEAGVNLAMINYYFKSKENLFDIVFYEMVGILFQKNGEIIFSDQSFFEKIENVVSNYMDVLNEDPKIPIFVLGELTHNPDLIINKLKNAPLLKPAIKSIKNEIKVEIENGNIKPVDPVQLTLNILSLSIFPFMAKSMICELSSLYSRDFDEIMINRKQSVVKFIIDAIKV